MIGDMIQRGKQEWEGEVLERGFLFGCYIDVEVRKHRHMCQI